MVIVLSQPESIVASLQPHWKKKTVTMKKRTWAIFFNHHQCCDHLHCCLLLVRSWVRHGRLEPATQQTYVPWASLAPDNKWPPPQCGLKPWNLLRQRGRKVWKHWAKVRNLVHWASAALANPVEPLALAKASYTLSVWLWDTPMLTAATLLDSSRRLQQVCNIHLCPIWGMKQSSQRATNKIKRQKFLDIGPKTDQICT